MTTKQQQEALDYFSSHAGDWRSKAEGVGRVAVNIIEQRNGYVRQVTDERQATRSFLDVGCGTGELVCDLARRGVESTGVDYAPEMIALGSKKAQDEGVAGARFVCASIFDFPMQPGSLDLISANGFIEYISLEQMEAFFGLVAKALAPGGSFVVGSRNRLFNLVTMNEFTRQDFASGSIDLLLQEAVQWNTAKGIADVVDSAFAPLQAPEIEHAKTGIDVATRFQYTPLQLISLLRKTGLEAVEVYPAHIHGVPPSFGTTNMDVHVTIANLLQAYARRNTQLLAQASTFMLHVRKAA